MDLASIGTVVATLKQIKEITEYLNRVSDNLKNAESRNHLARLTNEVSSLYTQIAAVQFELVEFKKENHELREKLAMRDQISFKKPFIWCGEGEKKDGPFCPRCYETDERLIHVLELNNPHNGAWNCRTCGNIYRDGTHIPSSGFATGGRTLSGELIREGW